MLRFLKKSEYVILLTLTVFLLIGITVSTGKSITPVSAYSTSAASAIVIESNTGKVLYEKNADEKRQIASTTKILTAITVLENTDDLEKMIKIPDEAVGVEGSSIYLRKGEELRVIDLLYGLMLRSGNDCAVALACITSGSVENFSVIMNMTAKRAGACSSHFCNPHGLPDDNHYSTARDMVMISAYAMKNDVFRKIVSTKIYKDCSSPDGGNRTFLNKNKILNMVEGGNGLKTGYTKAAGRCLISSAERNGKQIICVVLNCGPMFEESRDLIDEAFEKLMENEE